MSKARDVVRRWAWRILKVAVVVAVLVGVVYWVRFAPVSVTPHPIVRGEIVAPNTVILGLIMQQALVLGVLGYGIAYLFGQKVFPMFPRRVILTEDDLIQLAVIVLVISVASSLLGIWKAMRVSPNEALS